MKGRGKKASPGTTHVPRQIVLPPEEGEEVDPELEQQLQTWRYGSFMIFYNEIEETSMIIDTNGGTFVRHLGTLDEVFAIVGALLPIRIQGQQLYPDEYTDLEDEEFIVEGMNAMEEIMSDAEEPEDVDPTEVYNALRDQFINELIKPPEKDE